MKTTVFKNFKMNSTALLHPSSKICLVWWSDLFFYSMYVIGFLCIISAYSSLWKGKKMTV